MFVRSKFVDAIVATQRTFTKARIVPTNLRTSKILHRVTSNPRSWINEGHFVYPMTGITMNQIIIAAGIAVKQSGSERSEKLMRKKM
jgi:hypothetical protein